MRLIFLPVILFLLFQVSYAQTINHWETAIFKTDTWRYFVGNTEPPGDWRELSFNDSTWSQGIGGFGFGDNDDNTTIPQTTSVYIRIKFTVADTAKIAAAILNMDYDDAFVAYLNDEEIARVGISGIHPPYNALGNNHEALMYSGGLPETFHINKENLRLCLLPGENVLAIQVHNSSVYSTDLSSNAWLSFGITDATVMYRTVPSWFKTPIILTSSNLPIVTITTNAGEKIMDEPKITASMKIINYGPFFRNNITDYPNAYNGLIGIELRGSYSQSLPQKPYGIETRDSFGNNLNVNLLGMPKENDWILLANYNDKSFLRNSLARRLFKSMGHYAPRMRYCEVVINGEYQGIYLLTEKIKQDNDRVKIAKLDPDDNAGDSLTGGYIFKTDYYDEYCSWLSSYSPINKPGANVYFVYHDPKPTEITNEQKNYIQSYINTLETALYSDSFANPETGYRAYLDVNSFIDYFIIGELSRNIDAYKKSRFFYKNRDDKDHRVYSGPVWDYDWAWKNISDGCPYFNNTSGSGWAYRINECDPWPVPPSWEVRMMQDTTFANAINARYFSLRENILSQSYIDYYIDSIANLLNEAQERHFTKWPILGLNVGTPEVDAQPTTFEGEIQKFKNWIATRLAWLDDNMVGRKGSTVSTPLIQAVCRVFPNPVATNLYVESDTKIESVEMYGISGQVMYQRSKVSSYLDNINVSHLKPGIYIVKVVLSNGKTVISKVKKI